MTDVGWKCIESYFAETRYPRSRNCIDSYDDFLDIGMPETIQAANPFVMSQDGNRLELFIATPKLVLGKALVGTPEERTMLPNEARMLDKTYGADIIADIRCKFSKPQGSGEYVIENMKLGSIPIMLHSKACALRGMSDSQLAAAGECMYDEGGYHVIEGSEKIVTSRDTIAMNKLMVTAIAELDDETAKLWSNKKVLMEGRIFCRARGDQYPRKMTFLVRPDNSIDVQLSVSRTLRMRGELTLPLFTLFRLVGLETDEDIMEAVYGFSVGIAQETVYEMLRTCAVHARHHGHSHASAMAHARGALAIGQPLRVPEIEGALRASVFPNASSDVHLHLARAVAELLGCMAGRPVPDRDSQYLKRVESPGAKIWDMFRDVYAEVKRLTTQALAREWTDTRAQGVPLDAIFKQQTAARIFQSAVLTELMQKALRGSWISPAPGSVQQEGVVHTLPRASIHAALAYQNRVTNPAPPSLKRREPRMLRGDQFGYICAVHTPDGNNVGLVKQLAMFARITPRNVDVSAVMKAAFESGARPLTGEIPQGDTPILVDGTLEGFCTDPKRLRDSLVAARREGAISQWVSVHYIVGVSTCVEISCDGGRLARPLLVVQSNGTYTKKAGFSELLASAAMEYIDAQEIECCRVAMMPSDIVAGMTTHLELHPSVMLSPIPLLTPFSDHNAAPRNIFSCKQTTACASLYASNYRARIDTVNLLHHPQRPLVGTRYGSLMGADDMPNGENAIVAIMTYTGSNQEDAVILNASAVQRGLFNTTHIELISCDEESAEGNLDRFAHPVASGVVELRGESYSNIDASGLPVPGSAIHMGDAIVGKVRKQGGSGLVVDTSLVAGITHHGVVDRVAVIPLNRGQRRCKIRVHDFRQPTVGDKFASRHGQKGVCGRLLDEVDMPFTDDGVVPDIIMNPHAYPSRMTTGQLLETLCAKATVFDGVAVDATPFMKHDLDQAAERLSKHADMMCDELMCSGTQGTQHDYACCVAPTYYQRLKQQVAEKVAATRVARRTSITNQPAQGRSKGGGIRTGEMERDSLLGNGLMQFVKETMVDRSDRPPRPTTFISGKPKAMNRTHETWDRPDESAAITDVFVAEVPTAMTAMMSELGAMCIDLKVGASEAGR